MHQALEKTVLIIEDDPNTAALVALYLEREGFRAVTAENGETGLALAHRHRPVLVVLDLMLPKMDGWEVCRQLRKKSEVPVIMLTARDEEIDRVSGLTLGAVIQFHRQVRLQNGLAEFHSAAGAGKRLGEDGSELFHGAHRSSQQTRRLAPGSSVPRWTQTHRFAILYQLGRASVHSQGRFGKRGVREIQATVRVIRIGEYTMKTYLALIVVVIGFGIIGVGEALSEEPPLSQIVFYVR